MVCLWLGFIILILRNSLMGLVVVRVRMRCDMELFFHTVCVRFLIILFYFWGCGYWERWEGARKSLMAP